MTDKTLTYKNMTKKRYIWIGLLSFSFCFSHIFAHKRGDNRIYGLTDNVAEYTQDGMVVAGGENTVLKFIEAKDSETPIGFRLKLTVVSKK